MGHIRRQRLSLVAALLAAGCGQTPDIVTVRVVAPLGLVEVHRTPLAPVQGIDRLWRRSHGERIDTVPGVRAFGPVRVVGDSLVIGFHAEDQGVPVVFQYDAGRGILTQSALPPWLSNALFNPPPEFAPGGRHVLLLARLPDGMLRVEVHSWPDGALILAGRPIRPNPGASHSPVISWGNATDFMASLPVVSDTGPIVLHFNGRLSGGSGQLDSATRYLDVKPPPTPRGLRPSALPTLPRAFRAELERRGCTVQQSHRSENVISGHFAAATQVDWAALCSQRGQSTILVYWGGAAQCPPELRAAPDYQYQMRAGERVSFVRSIRTTEHYQVHDAAGRPVLPERVVKLDHDAIEDHNGDAASTIWSCQGGKWVEFPGRGSQKTRVLQNR
jgi:hypothetical protein